VNQGDVNKAVGFGVENHHPVLADANNFGVSNLIGFSIGKPQLERLEGLPSQPLPNRFCIHARRFFEKEYTPSRVCIIPPARVNQSFSGGAEKRTGESLQFHSVPSRERDMAQVGSRQAVVPNGDARKVLQVPCRRAQKYGLPGGGENARRPRKKGHSRTF